MRVRYLCIHVNTLFFASVGFPNVYKYSMESPSKAVSPVCKEWTVVAMVVTGDIIIAFIWLSS